MARLIDPFEQFFDGAGNPLIDGRVDFFESGSSTVRKTTYADSGETITNPNPVPLAADGRAPNVFGSGSYRAILKDASGVQVAPQRDPIGGDQSLSFGADWLEDRIYSISDVVRQSGKYWASVSSDNVGNNPSLDTGDDWLDFVLSTQYNLTQSIGDRLDTIQVSSIDALASLDVTTLSVDQVIEVVSYYDGWQGTIKGPVGGSLMVYDATRAKTDHNGGTVISPTVPTTPTLIDYLQAVGETDGAGLGCFVVVNQDDHYRVEQFGARLDGIQNDGIPSQAAIYAAGTANVPLVKCGPGTIEIGDPVLPTAIYLVPNVSFQGAPNFGTKLSKNVFNNSAGWHMINGKPDATENYHDPFGTPLNGTGDPITFRNNVMSNLQVQFGIGLWTVKGRECGVDTINAGPSTNTAAVFGNDATEPCVNVFCNNVSRNEVFITDAWFTIGFFQTSGFTINGVTQKAQSNSAAIKLDNCEDGVLSNVAIDNQTKVFNGVDILEGNNITVDKSCTFVRCLSAFVSFANSGGYTANCTFSGTSRDCINHVRLYTLNNTITGSVSIGATNAVRLEADALVNKFIGNDFKGGALKDDFGLVNNQDWVGNIGLQEGLRPHTSISDQIITNSSSGSITVTSAGECRISAGTSQSIFLGANGDPLTIGIGALVMRPTTDLVMDFGLAGNRWKEIYCVNPVINTCDRNEKTDFKSIPQYMIDAALEIKGNIQLWRWISSVNSKGDDARFHVGPIAQDVYEICLKHIGLAGASDDPLNYSFICRDDLLDDDGEVIGERWGLRPVGLMMLIIAHCSRSSHGRLILNPF